MTVLESMEKARGDMNNCGLGPCGATAQFTYSSGLLGFVGDALALLRLGESAGSMSDSVRFLECTPKSI